MMQTKRGAKKSAPLFYRFGKFGKFQPHGFWVRGLRTVKLRYILARCLRGRRLAQENRRRIRAARRPVTRSNALFCLFPVRGRAERADSGKGSSGRKSRPNRFFKQVKVWAGGCGVLASIGFAHSRAQNP